MSRTTHRALLVSMLAAMAFVVSACGGGGGGGSDGGGASGAGGEEVAEIGPADVTIVNFAYEDPEYTAAVGDEVVWVNEGAAPHTVTGDDFDSGVIRSGNGWTHTFEEPGTYEYWCTNHEGAMSGTIVVE
jgi:plastocyanin